MRLTILISRPIAAFGNPETVTRIAQYEMAFRMQMDATDAMDIRKEPEPVRAMYGSKPGEASFANNCLVARRLAERGCALHSALSLGMGFSRRRRQGGIEPGLQRSLPRSGSTDCRATRRPERARHARRHAGCLGRRIRHVLPCGKIAMAKP